MLCFLCRDKTIDIVKYDMSGIYVCKDCRTILKLKVTKTPGLSKEENKRKLLYINY